MKKIIFILMVILIGCGDCDTFKSDLYDARVNEFIAERTSGGIVYMGDSITQYCGVFYPEFFGPTRRNRGIANAGITDMINLALDVINNEKPELVYLQIGTNDIAQGRSGNCIQRDMEILINVLDAPVVILNIPPDLPRYDGIHLDRAACMELLQPYWG